MKPLMSTAFSLIISTAILAWKGYVIVKLWNWFVVNQFGLSAISISEAIGLGLLVNLLSYQFSLTDNDATMEQIDTSGYLRTVVSVGISIPTVCLSIG